MPSGYHYSAIPAIARQHDQFIEEMQGFRCNGKVDSATGCHFRDLGRAALMEM